MKIYEMTFSPTGGTKKISDILTNDLEGKTVSVDLTDGKTDFQSIVLTQEDVAVLAVPSYAGRVPAIAVEKLFFSESLQYDIICMRLCLLFGYDHTFKRSYEKKI